MAVNPFFAENEENSEAELLNDLIMEAIQQAGKDVRYIPRRLYNYDRLFGTDDSSRFDSSYLIEMYVKSIYGFGGDKDFFSQFGHQVRDEVIFVVSKQRFEEEIGNLEGMIRPHEGDIIYFPMNKRCFQIKFVDPREMFYQLGRLYTYELTCEVFEYSGEKFDTGFDDIDDISQLSLNALDWVLTDNDGYILADADGNILVQQDFDPARIDPGNETEYLPPETKKITGFDVTIQDPFGDNQ